MASTTAESSSPDRFPQPAALGVRGWSGLIVIWSVTVAVLSRRLFDNSLGYPDADRILMDGVFVLDFLKDLPLNDIYQYTIEYYGQYPALSIGYRPPFFPFVEALFNAVFGVNVWSSRLAIQAFALVGITAWFLLVRRVFDTNVAVLACLVFITLPFVAKWGWYTMAELPLVSMTMLTAYLFYRYAEALEPRFMYAAAVSFVLTVWTKQTAFYLALWFVLALVLDRSLLRAFANKHAWIGVLGVLAALIPLAMITLWLGDQNLAQSTGVGLSMSTTEAASQRFENLYTHLKHLTSFQLPPLTLILAAAGLVMSIARKDGRTLYFWLLILTTYGFFAYILNPNERYTIFWLPAFSVFAVLPAFYLGERHPRLGKSLAAAVLAAVGLHGYLIYSNAPHYATGYDKAADYVVANSHSPAVLVDAYNNGYFTYFVRQADVDRSMYVLRGDKLFTSSSIGGRNKLQVHAQTRTELQALMDEYGVEYIVVEDKNYTPVDIHDELRRFLQEGPFEKELEVAVDATRSPLRDAKLIVYRYLERKPPSGRELMLRLPVVGKSITIPFPAAKP